MFSKFGRKALGMVLALALIAGLISSAQAQERAAAINATTGNYAVIAPIFTSGSGPFSYIRLVYAGDQNTTSTYSITIVGAQTGQVYGHSFTVQVPHMGGAQFAIDQLVQFAGATFNSFSGGDSGYAVYIQDTDPEAGYQHVVFNQVSQLFENISTCGSLLNEQVVAGHNQLVLSYIHTSKGPVKPGTTYPSAIQIHNYYNVPITYTITVFNAGSQTHSVSPASTSGLQSCQIRNNTIPANTTMTLSESTIEANSSCTFFSDEDYINLTIADQTGGPPNAVATHLVHASAYGSDVTLTDVCAVNKVVPVSTGATGGNTCGIYC